jgi:hypothetical protein
VEEKQMSTIDISIAEPSVNFEIRNAAPVQNAPRLPGFYVGSTYIEEAPAQEQTPIGASRASAAQIKRN